MIQEQHAYGDLTEHDSIAPPDPGQGQQQEQEHVEDENLSGPPVADILEQLQDGTLAPADLDPAVRRQCVLHLTMQGFSSSEIAQLMTMTDRTVRRDRAALRKEERLEPSLTLGDELLGEFQRLALCSVQRLTRLATDQQTPAYARLWAEDAIARIYQRFIDTARKLGYLETAHRRLHQMRAPVAQGDSRGRAARPLASGLSDSVLKHTEALVRRFNPDG